MWEDEILCLCFIFSIEWSVQYGQYFTMMKTFFKQKTASTIPKYMYF